MSQTFKTVYFPDHPGPVSSQRNVTLAFGASDNELYQAVRPLSGEELREMLGHFTFRSLRRAAEQNGLALNTFCLRQLRETIGFREGSRRQAWLPGFVEDFGIPIDPIQATFRGGKAEPLHDWYPYLEGYSPDFVTRLMLDFAPDAQHVLDPFSGCGTTPLTVARMGRAASYCEINPLLQFLTRVKTAAGTISERARHSLAGRLEELSGKLALRLRATAPDAELMLAYAQIFGTSRFFSDEVLDTVLRVRALLDDVECDDLNLAEMATVAVLASLVVGSNLIRRGDLRYKTDDEAKRLPGDLLGTLRARLRGMAQDLRRLEPMSSRPRLVCEDARGLASIPHLSLDAVITSPPYLNGTNYFRNTKIELWFLRCLGSQNDLATFRFRSVTAGINDVTVAKPSEIVSARVRDVVNRLQESAYDPRIPLMAQSYFYDMSTVFDAITGHLEKNAILLIDTGDSAYGGVRVPTHELLAEILSQKGFGLERQIVLRKRMSRGGIPLSQSLLVMRREASRKRRPACGNRFPLVWYANWKRFKETLPHQHGDFAKRNWGHPLHSLCSYQGKMKPSLARSLVRTFAPPGGAMLDPFGGVGTIPFEAALYGVRAWSFDISPTALHICAAKLEPANLEKVDKVIAALDASVTSGTPTHKELQDVESIRMNGPLVAYFHPRTFSEIILARRFFLKNPPRSPAESLVFASLLHILHGNRPYALSRRSHPITPFSPTGPAEYRPMIPRLRDKVTRSLATGLPAEFRPGRSLFQDATGWWPQEIRDLDAVITSPPFFDSTRFYMANWMRLWFAGWTADDFKYRPRAFVDERQKKGFSVYEPVFRQARERLKTGGVMVLHLGRSKKCDMAASLAEVARTWFKIVDVFAESVGHCESHGIRDKGAVVEHTFMVLH